MRKNVDQDQIMGDLDGDKYHIVVKALHISAVFARSFDKPSLKCNAFS